MQARVVNQNGHTVPEINEEECLKHPYTVHTLRHYTGALTDIRPPETAFYF